MKYFPKRSGKGSFPKPKAKSLRVIAEIVRKLAKFTALQHNLMDQSVNIGATELDRRQSNSSEH